MLYAPNSTPSEFTNQKLMELKGEIEKSTIVVGNLNTLLSN